MSETTTEAIADAWTNEITGLEGPRDKNRRGGSRAVAYRLDDGELDALYESNSTAARIVDRLPDDSIRGGFSVKGKDCELDWPSIRSQLDDLDVDNVLADAWRWSRLYRGSLIVAAVNDGHRYHEPLDLGRISGISAFQVVEAPYAQAIDWNVGLGSRGYLQPQRYLIRTRRGSSMPKVHWSRVHRFDGVRLPRSKYAEHGDGWGIGVLQRVYDELKATGQAFGYSASMMHTMSIPLMRIAGLRSRIAESGKTQSTMKSYAQAVFDLASNLRVWMVDAEDEVSHVERDMRGISDLLDRFVDALVRATDMPREILLGVTDGGLNSGENAGPFRAWYDHVAAQQRKVLRPAIDWILSIVFAWRRSRGERMPDEWEIEFAPLWQPTEKERAETHVQRVTADVQLVTVGAISVDELRGAPHIVEAYQLQDRPGRLGPPEEIEADPTEEGLGPDPETKAELALTGVQINALTGIAQLVAEGALPQETAVEMIVMAFPIPREQAARMLAPIQPAGPVSPGAPTSGPEGDDERAQQVESPFSPPPGEALMSAKDLGAQLGCSAASITAMHKRGEIPGWQVGGRWKFAFSQILQATHRPVPSETPPVTSPPSTEGEE